MICKLPFLTFQDRSNHLRTFGIESCGCVVCENDRKNTYAQRRERNSFDELINELNLTQMTVGQPTLAHPLQNCLRNLFSDLIKPYAPDHGEKS